MKPFLIVIAACIVKTVLLYKRRPICHACFDSTCYTRSVIIQNYIISGQIAVERKGNVLHFHYKHRKKDYTEAFDLSEVKFLNIPGIEFSFARAVDQLTRNVYIGGAKGISKYSPISNQTTSVGLTDKIISHLQFKENIYYTEFKKKGLYTFTDKKSTSVEPLSDYMIDDFIVDKMDDIYFMANFTMYRLKRSDEKPKLFSNVIYFLSTDINDNAYFVQSTNKGLYKIDYSNGNLIEIGAFSDCMPVKVVFDDYNNVIYYDSDNRKLFYLTPNYGRCKVRNIGKGENIKMVSSSFDDIRYSKYNVTGNKMAHAHKTRSRYTVQSKNSDGNYR